MCIFKLFCVIGYAVGSIKSDIRIHVHFNLLMNKFDSTKCNILNLDSVMMVEAILFAADRIQQDNILNGASLGILIIDTCKKPKKNPYVLVIDNGMVVVGPYSSELSEFTTQFLSIFKYSTISFGASADKFYDQKKGFTEFFTTVPPDSITSLVYTDMAMHLKWEYTGLLYSANEDGSSPTVNVIQRLSNVQYCVVQYQMNLDATEKEYQTQIKSLLSLDKVKVVFLFLSLKGCQDFFRAAVPFGEQLSSKVFVLSSVCGTMVYVPHEIQPYLTGMLTVQMTDPQPEEFREYFKHLTPWNNKRNEYYFAFYWKFLYNCSLDNTTSPDYCKNITNDHFNRFTPVRPVINALYTAVYSIKAAYDIRCHGKESWCYEVENENVKQELDKYIPQVDINVFNKTFKYANKLHQVIESYDIFQYQNKKPGHYHFNKIGFWDAEKWKNELPALSLDENVNITNSKCSLPCKPREIKEYFALASCCWQCKTCPKTSIIIRNTCEACALGYKANEDQSKCDKLKVVTLSPTGGISIAVICISCAGFVLIAVILAVYLKNFSSHIIKSSSRELALFSLFGLAGMLLTSVCLTLPPNKLVCYAQKMLIGISLTCVYAPLVLKTNRVYRIFASSSKFKLRRLMLVSMPSQFFMIFAMVGIEILMGVFWILTDKPVVITKYPIDRNFILQQCYISGPGAALNLVFPIALMVACTFWAFKTRNLPEIFSEIKSIGVTMYITLFLATSAFALIFILSGVSAKPFLDIYVVCFTFQAIVLVNLIGQYAMKIKTLYQKSNELDLYQDNQTVTSVVMSNRFISPKTSPNGNDGQRHLSLATESLPDTLYTRSVSTMKLASPNLNVKRMSYDWQ